MLTQLFPIDVLLLLVPAASSLGRILAASALVGSGSLAAGAVLERLLSAPFRRETKAVPENLR
jgi:hypothetical protein